MDKDIFNFKTYKKKPVAVECAELTEESWQKLSEQPNNVMYVSKRQVCATRDVNCKKYFLIDTLEGLMKANIGDMLIVGVKGETYSCDKDIFEQTYEETTKTC